MAAKSTEVEAPKYPPTQRQQAAQKKRPASDGLENEQRLSKRFDLLNLVENNGTRLYIPVSSQNPSQSLSATTSSSKPPKPVALPVEPESKKSKKPQPRAADDFMQVEDTPNRVYIHDLAAELSDIESDEENPIFLADIEKHLSRIPKHVLVGPEPKATRENQLILYNIPSSISVPEEQDNVRKAIVEARARMREKQVSGIGEPRLESRSESHPSPGLIVTPKKHNQGSIAGAEHDPDDMEIDEI
ncbi:hypothetical protein AOQ84DRAFT_291467 [Glonium stellatum]|uniref:Uncharacterized protein n=1 Tax=Glonium stellatum TaxID=574774 RepID=A0A8E2F2D8_9PEZI|nr:hypothetical protein AOQ84DRAFT_291467 [Glonium stellatum]